MVLPRIATRYLQGHRKRYVFVLIILSLGFSFITVASTLSEGMEESVTLAALRHYAGHLFVIGRDRGARSIMVIDDGEDAVRAIERTGIPVERIVYRTHEHNGATLFHQGAMVSLKDLFGVDFHAETDLFRSARYAEGTFDRDWPEDTIIVSAPTARQLRVRTGDEITLRIENRNRQVDTGTFVVRAIIDDSSIYGYARAYVARESLTSLMALDPGEYSMIGVFLADPAQAPYWARRLHDELSGQLPVAPMIETKEDLTARIRERWEGARYFTFALPVYISEVTDLLIAMQLGAYLLLGMIILVVLAAVVVTYRVVLHERTREIGTMLALGFPRVWIGGMLLIEALVLLVLGILLGLIVSLVMTGLVSLVSFDWIPGFEIFLRDGRLMARYTARTVGINALVVIGTVLPVTALMVASVVRNQIPALIKGETT